MQARARGDSFCCVCSLLLRMLALEEGWEETPSTLALTDCIQGFLSSDLQSFNFLQLLLFPMHLAGKLMESPKGAIPSCCPEATLVFLLPRLVEELQVILMWPMHLAQSLVQSMREKAFPDTQLCSDQNIHQEVSWDMNAVHQHPCHVTGVLERQYLEPLGSIIRCLKSACIMTCRV